MYCQKARKDFLKLSMKLNSHKKYRVCGYSKQLRKRQFQLIRIMIDDHFLGDPMSIFLNAQISFFTGIAASIWYLKHLFLTRVNTTASNGWLFRSVK